MFSRSSRASSGRLSTNNPQRVPRSEVRYTTSEAGSDLESRQGASRPHWIIPTLSSSFPLFAHTRPLPRETSRNCDKEVANHRRDGRARSFPSFRQSGRTSAMISFVRIVVETNGSYLLPPPLADAPNLLLSVNYVPSRWERESPALNGRKSPMKKNRFVSKENKVWKLDCVVARNVWRV